MKRILKSYTLLKTLKTSIPLKIKISMLKNLHLNILLQCVKTNTPKLLVKKTLKGTF